MAEGQEVSAEVLEWAKQHNLYPKVLGTLTEEGFDTLVDIATLTENEINDFKLGKTFTNRLNAAVKSLKVERNVQDEESRSNIASASVSTPSRQNTSDQIGSTLSLDNLLPPSAQPDTSSGPIRASVQPQTGRFT